MALKDLLRSARGEQASIGVRGELDRFIVRRENAPSGRREDVWHPSDLSAGLCVRQAVLQARNPSAPVPREIDTALFRIFDVGTAVHRWYQEEYLGPMGVLWGRWRCSRCHTLVVGTMPKGSCEACQWGEQSSNRNVLTPAFCYKTCGTEGDLASDPAAVRKRGGCIHCGKWGRWEFAEVTVVIEELNIAGHTDGLLVEYGESEPVAVLEIKTANDRSFGAIAATKPTDTHIRQVNLYMHGIRRQHPRVDRALMLYVCKNDGRVHEHVVPYDPAVVQPLLDDVQEAERCLRTEDELPPRHDECPHATSKRARGCPVVGPCFADRA